MRNHVHNSRAAEAGAAHFAADLVVAGFPFAILTAVPLLINDLGEMNWPMYAPLAIVVGTVLARVHIGEERPYSFWAVHHSIMLVLAILTAWFLSVVREALPEGWWQATLLALQPLFWTAAVVWAPWRITRAIPKTGRFAPAELIEGNVGLSLLGRLFFVSIVGLYPILLATARLDEDGLFVPFALVVVVAATAVFIHEARFASVRSHWPRYHIPTMYIAVLLVSVLALYQVSRLIVAPLTSVKYGFFAFVHALPVIVWVLGMRVMGVHSLDGTDGQQKAAVAAGCGGAVTMSLISLIFGDWITGEFAPTIFLVFVPLTFAVASARQVVRPIRTSG